MQTSKATSKAKGGFTLIELLIVIAIIGLLATLAIVSLTTAQRKARDTKRIADVKQLQNAVELYYSEKAAYPTPTSLQTWSDFSTLIGSYITNVPIDPTNNATSLYTYAANDAASEYFIGATLEDTAHSALGGDDDVNYTAAGAWLAIDTVESDGTSDATIAYNCADPNYCTSE